MIASMHIADVGAGRAPALLRRAPRVGATPGLVYADLLLAARLSAAFLPRLHPGRVALFAVWRDDEALDGFLADDPLARAFVAGRAVRLRPLRVSGSWTGLPDLIDAERSAAPDGPVAVLTYGRLKLHRATAFLRTSARAEADAVGHPGMLSATGLARPPRLVSTFSLWSSVAAMDDYAHHGAGHAGALRANAERDFHHESIFIRLRPYAIAGDWDGARH